jgi:prepilin-type N-terminal cleavage/methylation domain-containing protein
MKKGFTLAEVLITLTIVGVVASITLPSLNNSMWKGQRGPLLKNAQSRINNAFSIAIQDDLGYTPKCAYIKNEVDDENIEDIPENWIGDFDENECKEFGDAILKNLRYTRECSNTTDATDYSCHPEYKSGDGFYDISASKTFYTQSGMSIINYNSEKDYFSPEIFIVDTNGVKGPNKWGQDLFVFTTNYARNRKNIVLKPSNNSTLVEYYNGLEGASAEEILRNKK